MYNLTAVAGYQFRFGPEDPIYVLDILPVALGLAATASDQTLTLFDPSNLNHGPVKSIKLDHGSGTVATVYDPSESVICTTGENGAISVWDLRHDPLKAPAMKIQGTIQYPFALLFFFLSLFLITDTFPFSKGSDVPLLSLATSSATNSLAAGTELANHQAAILIW